MEDEVGEIAQAGLAAVSSPHNAGTDALAEAVSTSVESPGEELVTLLELLALAAPEEADEEVWCGDGYRVDQDGAGFAHDIRQARMMREERDAARKAADNKNNQNDRRDAGE